MFWAWWYHIVIRPLVAMFWAWWYHIVIRPLVDVWKKSIQLQGARGLDLQRVASGDTHSYQVPELRLNFCMVCELFVQILVSGLGALAFVWATVVLLGGFSTSLQEADFWVITGIVFIQTARVVGLNVNPEAEFFSQVPPAFLELGAEHFTEWGQKRQLTGQATGRNFRYYLMLALGSAQDLITLMAILVPLILAVPTVAGLACIALSIFRLVFLLEEYPGDSNLLRVLTLFYVLVLLQGVLFIFWLELLFYRSVQAARVSSKYGFEDKKYLIDKYINRTLSTAIKNGVSSTINRNLVSFAADLIKSDYSQDRIEAVLVLHTLASKDAHRERTLLQIQSSPLCIARLLQMVSSKSRIDQKICIAQIIAGLASNLRLADISGATESISSMINPYLTKISTPATNVNIDQQRNISIAIGQQGTLQSPSATNGEESITNDQQGTLQSPSNTSGAESKPLIIHGLLILAKLAGNPENCKQIYNSKGLFSKIIAPVKNKVYEILSDDCITMEITEKALDVVSMLVSGTDETNIMIRQDICRNEVASKDICPILRAERTYNKLKVPATKILTKLSLDMSTRDTIGFKTMAEFISVLMNMFFDAANESGLRKTAGKALARLAMDKVNCTMMMASKMETETSVVQLLTAMLSEANHRLYRTAIAQLLMQFCANSNSSAERERLESVKTVLHEVLKVVCDVEPEANPNQPDPPQHSQGVSTLLRRVFHRLKSFLGALGLPVSQARSPPLLLRILHHLNSSLGARHAANRNTPDDNLPIAVAQLVGGRRKTLAAFLGLTMQICDRLMTTADDFDTALGQIPLPIGEFVDKLNEIIEQCKGHSVGMLEGKGPSGDYLVIIKTVTKLCTWVMQSKPDYITEFQNKDTSTKLKDAREDMRELERGMLLSSSAGDMDNYETLSSIVAAARQEMDPNVQV